MKMNFFHSLALIIGALVLIEVSCSDPMVIRKGDPSDLAEGYSYERFNFLTELNVNNKYVDNELYWNSCSNYTGINFFLNKTESEDCYGEVINCTAIPINRREHNRAANIYKFNVDELLKMMSNMRTNEICHCLCNRQYDRKPHSSVRELLDSICLDEVSADVKNGYVLTGVRLNRLNNTIVFEIQEGKLREGVIFEDTLRWVPRQKKCNNIGLMIPSKRTLILDDVIFTGNTIATGVAFKRYSDIPYHERIHPESMEVIEKDPFFLSVIGHGLSDNNNLINNYRLEMSVWNYSLADRTNLIDDNMDISIAVMLPFHNHVLSKPKENYVTFNLAAPQEGLRQFVIPYVDSQNVTDSNYPQFVKGIGLYYKGFDGYGGYVAPSIFVPLY